MVNFGLPTIPTSTIYLILLAGLGFVVLFFFAKRVTDTKFIIVEPGTKPEKAYAEWFNAKLSKRLGKGNVFLFFSGLGMLLAGILGLLIWWLL